MARCFSASASAFWRCWSAVSRSTSRALVWNTSSARAMAPISLRIQPPSTTPSSFPAARSVVVRESCCNGLVMERASTIPAAIIASSSPAITSAKWRRAAAVASRVSWVAAAVDRPMAACVSTTLAVRAANWTSVWAIIGMPIRRSMAAIWFISSTALA